MYIECTIKKYVCSYKILTWVQNDVKMILRQRLCSVHCTLLIIRPFSIVELDLICFLFVSRILSFVTSTICISFVQVKLMVENWFDVFSLFVFVVSFASIIYCWRRRRRYTRFVKLWTVKNNGLNYSNCLKMYMMNCTFLDCVLLTFFSV